MTNVEHSAGHADDLTVRQLATRFGPAAPSVAQCRSLGLGFLVVRSSLHTDARPVGARFATVAVSRDRLDQGSPLSGSEIVMPVPTAGKPPLTPWVGVGRLSRNMLVIPDPSVSKLHALIRYVDGRFQIADAGSKNGTHVNGTASPRYDRGDPTTLKPGDILMLGSVGLWFLGPAELARLVDTWAGSPPVAGRPTS
jgi:hypothetical protein